MREAMMSAAGGGVEGGWETANSSAWRLIALQVGGGAVALTVCENFLAVG